jgi:HPt (histidine-containing phosphotransfer) domain-containing protein
MNEGEKLLAFDFATYMDNFRGMEDFALETIQIFIDSLPKLLFSIENAIDSKNSYELVMAAHNLKGAVSNFFAEPSRLIAAQLEQAASDNRIDTANQIFSILKIELERLLVALRDAISRNQVA